MNKRLWAHRHHRPILFRSDSNIAKDLYRTRNQYRLLFKKKIVSALLKQVRAYLTIGKANEDYYRYYGACCEQFYRASYMVNVSQFADDASRQRAEGMPLRREFGIMDSRVLLYVGRFVWEKDIPTLARAFGKALPEVGDVTLLMVGDGPQEQEVRKIIEPFSDHVHFAGFAQPEQLGALYGMADAFILPSIQDAWGLVINEAMAAGLPIIASDRVGAAADLVMPGQTGFIFRGGDVDDLAEKLIRLFSTPGLCEQYGEAGRRHLAEWNSTYEVTAGYKKALDEAIAGYDRR